MNIFSLRKPLLTFVFLGLSLINNPLYSFAKPLPTLSAWPDSLDLASISHENFDVNSVLDEENPNDPQGGILKLTTTCTYDTFHRYATRGRATHYVMYTYESLGEPMPNVPNVLRGLLAESFDLSEDRTILRVKLNPLAKFSDGSKVKASDVVFTYEAIQTKANPLYKIGYEDVVSVVAESESTVVYTFKPDASRELALDVCLLPVFAEKWWEGRDFAEPQNDPILGSGPYQIDQSNFGVRFSLIKDQNYWAKDFERNKGSNNFDEIIVDFYRDTAIAREAFFVGDVDYFLESAVKDWVNAYDVAPVRDGDISRQEFSRGAPVGMLGLGMNLRREFLQDKNVREALSLLMDFEWINKSIYYNSSKRINSYFTEHNLPIESMPTQEELAILNEYRDQLDPDVFGELPVIPVTKADGNVREQMAKAVALLKEAGWELKNGKMLDKDGKQMVLHFITNTANVQRTYAQYVKNLGRIGIDLQIQVLDQNLYNAKMKEFDYDLCYAFIPLDYYPTTELLYYYGSEIANTYGSKNYIGLEDPVVDDLIQKMINSKSLKELNVYTKVLDRILQHGMYIIPGWYSPNMRSAWWKNRISPGNSGKINMLSGMKYWHIVE